MKQGILQSQTLAGIMTVTTDFINSNILPAYNRITINTVQLADYWQSIIYYE